MDVSWTDGPGTFTKAGGKPGDGHRVFVPVLLNSARPFPGQTGTGSLGNSLFQDRRRGELIFNPVERSFAKAPVPSDK